MALIKPVILDPNNLYFPAEIDSSDSLLVPGITVSGTADLLGNVVENVGTPVNPTDAATKAYVDSVASEDAERVTNTYTVEANVSAGDPVFVSSADNVSPCSAGNNSALKFVGLARTTTTLGNTVDIISSGVLEGILSGATPGDHYFLANGGGLTTSAPGGNSHVYFIGRAKNSTDLHIDPQYLGRKGNII